MLDGSKEQVGIETRMSKLIMRLAETVERSHSNSRQYREVLGKIESQTLSWENPQPESGEIEPESRTHFSRLENLIESLESSINQQSEMLEHFQHLI